MKTIVVYFRTGSDTRYTHTITGAHLGKFAAQQHMLRAKMGCARVLAVQHK